MCHSDVLFNRQDGVIYKYIQHLPLCLYTRGTLQEVYAVHTMAHCCPSKFLCLYIYIYMYVIIHGYNVSYLPAARRQRVPRTLSGRIWEGSHIFLSIYAYIYIKKKGERREVDIVTCMYIVCIFGPGAQINDSLRQLHTIYCFI